MQNLQKIQGDSIESGDFKKIDCHESQSDSRNDDFVAIPRKIPQNLAKPKSDYANKTPFLNLNDILPIHIFLLPKGKDSAQIAHDKD